MERLTDAIPSSTTLLPGRQFLQPGSPTSCPQECDRRTTVPQTVTVKRKHQCMGCLTCMDIPRNRPQPLINMVLLWLHTSAHRAYSWSVRISSVGVAKASEFSSKKMTWGPFRTMTRGIDSKARPWNRCRWSKKKSPWKKPRW